MRPDDPSPPIAAASGFGPATAAWFFERFGAATAVQAGGWPPILRGEHALLCAPTGSGKTLAAFLACLDRLSRTSGAGVRVLYISPLKALAHDIERNLRAPLEGIREAATRAGHAPPELRVAIRTGDTPARERRRLGREPADILITTPESLYLLLGSEARRVLTTVETVIVDEIHALAPTKRGAHLALSLERLCAQITAAGGRDPQRIGLSATQRPLEEVARFLGGARPVTIVDAGERPRLDLTIEVPGDLDEPTGARPVLGEESTGVWPALHARVLELVSSHRSTIVFTNSRRLCERLAQRLNELWAEAGHDHALVRAHHGSIAREQRVEIEELLKAGQLRGLVATSSLELGIDMGAIDLVVQIESPGAVARGLQRVGRAGHSIGERSLAKILPKFQQDLLEATVVARAMLDGEVEPIRVPRNALDVLAQQLVAMTVERPRSVAELGAIVRAAYPYQTLPEALLVEVLDMLAGRYPSAELADLRPRVIWDRATDQVTARKDARLVAIINGGTIPDRGLYGVYLEGGGPRVGELDEEMVYESRVGQTFLLGASSWRIVGIERDRVLVRPAPGEPGRMPFWRGEGPGRPIELGRALGAFLREVEPQLERPQEAQALLTDRYALDARAADNLCRYLETQRAATGVLPTDDTLVVERFRDELGDWRVCLLSPFGARVHAPLALAIEASLAERGQRAQTIYSDDGVVLRLPDSDRPPSIAGLLPGPEALEALLLPALRGSSLFASHFRQNAARALLLPRRRPGQRSPLWLQRQKAQTLLEVVGRHPGFPIVLETLRECLSDVFDVPALTDLLGRLRDGRLRLVEVETQRPSPFARSLAFAYVASYLYDGDAPVAERKAQALTLDQDLLRELLGEVEVRELLDPQAFIELEAELQRTTPERRARSADGLHDLLRGLGDLSPAEIAARVEGDAAAFAATLRADGRAHEIELGESRLVAVEDLALYRDALGFQPPPGVPAVYLAGRPDAATALLARYARTHTAFTLDALARRWGTPVEALTSAAAPLVTDGRLLTGAFRPDGEGEELCDPEVLRRLRHKTLATLRRSIAPIDPSALARFLPAWHGIGERALDQEGADRLREALHTLEGLALPFAELEARLLPARVAGYQPRLLDELSAAGEIVWIGRGLSGDDGLVAIYFREHLDTLMPAPTEPSEIELGPLHQLLVDALSRRGAMFVAQLQAAAPNALVDELEAALWDLAWAGRISNDTFAPLRARARRTPARRPSPRGRARSPRLSPTLTGRWSLTGVSPAEPTAVAHAQASMLLSRYGLVTREAAQAEGLPGGFSAVSDVLRAMEEAGRVRRGYFVEGLSGAQYALPGAVDRLRAAPSADERALVLSAIDPANPFGVFLDWPALDEGEGESGRPRRAAGATVVLVGGRPSLFLERGGKRLLVFAGAVERTDAFAAAVAALTAARPGGLRITEINGRPALRSRLATPLEQAGFRVEPGGLVYAR